MDSTLPEAPIEERPQTQYTLPEDAGASDGAHKLSTYGMPAQTLSDEGGSIVLIDPTTSGIIGTLTPASPEALGRSPSPTSVQQPAETDSDITVAALDGLDIDKKENRRDPTYTCRLSLSDVSLRTYRPGQGGDDGLPQLPISCLTGGATELGIEELGHKGGKGRMRSSWMTDDASFWTARGTLKMDEGGAEGKEREVVVAFVKADKDLDDLFSPYIPSPLASRSPLPDHDLETSPTSADNLCPATQVPSHLSSATNTTDSPFPSRILHLFPRLSTLPRGGGSAGSGLPTSPSGNSVWPGLGGLEAIDPASLVASAQSHAEAAFWRLIMPGISGIYGWSGMLGSAYQHVSSYLPITTFLGTAPLTGTVSAPLLIDSDHHSITHNPRLYSEETIYALRMPVSADTGAVGNSADAGIGPTVRPVWVKKRAALPLFQEREDGWGRESVLYR